MNSKSTKSATLALAIVFFGSMAANLSASDVQSQLSTREAYVGMPVVLQIAINNAQDYHQPAIPEIDGCDIRSAGTPSQNTQVTIINGRRSASRSVTLQYLITPRRTGTFEIPSINVNVDGRDMSTQPQRFVATKSDTGDLMFVEIEGGQDKVYVGQPLDLKLKVWIKPYRDQKKNITLSEADMWQRISEQTSWGSFADRINELGKSNQRPGGREVLRDDGQGNKRSYYLYEIDATVYPRRPGKVDADDVQVVASYPASSGKSRDPFDSFFKDGPFGRRSPFGGKSPLSQLMGDGIFSSPFSNRLSVSSARPIVAQATVDATAVIPVPVDGRPDNYRGAVGRYKIVTQATPSHVSAGDPITLNIGIAGTGPMEMVQAPPLANLASLSADFKVNDEPLAGFVQGKTKVFSTTIRPRREGITQIPAISFSFFDPETESFETVMSDPISITVDKAETLSLDTIVGSRTAGQRNEELCNDESVNARQLGPDLTNFESPSQLESQKAGSSSQYFFWWFFAGLPPMIWLLILFGVNRNALARRLPSFKSGDVQCRNAIKVADQRSQIVEALIRYIARKTVTSCSNSTSAVGALRTCGLYSVASGVEWFFAKCDGDTFTGFTASPIAIQQVAQDLVGQINSAFAGSGTANVKRKGQCKNQWSNDYKKSLRHLNGTAKRLPMLLIVLAAVTFSAGTIWADEHSASMTPVGNCATTAIVLTRQQQELVLAEASLSYSEASQLSESDSAEAKERFSDAADKYQLLVDSGVSNSQLYFNLGNAYLQNGELGLAIVNYERAKRLDPGHQQLLANLQFANSLVAGKAKYAEEYVTDNPSCMGWLRNLNGWIVATIGSRTVTWMLVLSSFLFWGILITRTLGWQFSTWRFAAIPMLVLLVSLVSCSLIWTSSPDNANGVIVAYQVQLHAGDGQQFDVVAALESSQGQCVQVLAQREKWIQIRTDAGDEGWVRDQNVKCITT